MSSLWDVTGIDALAVMIDIFGESVSQLAPFQSLETVLDGEACSVLRLCDRNFRIVASSFQVPTQQVYLHQFDWLSRIRLPIEQLSLLSSVATVRPPHRLKDLPENCAVPIQVSGIAVLLWYHPDQGQPILEGHTARRSLTTLLDALPQAVPIENHLSATSVVASA